ncbi:helix-turn-helix domain-containing protein, partial [Kribbella sp. CWNU-51]
MAAELFLAEMKALGEQDVLAPGTYQTYRYQYDKNLVPRIAEIRLVELTTSLVDGVIQAIRNEVGVASAKTCKSILSGTFSLAVRHGALPANPVREIKIRGKARRPPPRALEEDEREAWFELLRQDERAIRADLVDLCKFMLATGQRIGETLAVTWNEINRETGEVDCSHQIQRLRGQGLVRRRAKSAAGERILTLPDWALEMLIARLTPGMSPDSPIFPDSKGGFRDPHNVQHALRNARRPIGGQRRAELGGTLSGHRRRAGLTQAQTVAKLGWQKTRISLIETGRVRLEAEEAVALADAYGLNKGEQAALMELTELAGARSSADEMAWVTAHVFRKTTATILDDFGQTPRKIADQLGHSTTSTTINRYIGRRARNPEAAGLLDKALRQYRSVKGFDLVGGRLLGLGPGAVVGAFDVPLGHL